MPPEPALHDPLLGEDNPLLDDDDPFLEEILDAAMEGFAEIVPADVAAFVRDSIRDRLLFHPEGRRLVRQARPDPLVDRSRSVAKQRPT
jgi:hypothetical protein